MRRRDARHIVLLAAGIMLTSGSDAMALMTTTGSAELSYTKYDASVKGKDLLSGSTFAQKYNLSFMASNYVRRDQPQYYDLNLGYEWTDFDTKITEPTQDTTLSQSFGKFNYSGRVGYNPVGLPVRFSAYRTIDTPTTYSVGLSQNSLIGDGLMYSISDSGKNTSTGVVFAFEPDKSRSSTTRGLPRLYLDFREMISKNNDVNSRVDTRTRELAVAGLNKENNWLNYRTTTYENNLNPFDRYTRQQIQIGHVDSGGRRLWSSLTNWIEVSADGQLTNFSSPSVVDNYEEYDLNFMAVARRKTWDARTFMNYNRLLEQNDIKESVRLPVYVKGIYGADTTWYTSLSTSRGKETYLPGTRTSSSYVHAMSLGATTFSRSQFTLSPAVSLMTSKEYDGTDGYSLEASVESTSTARYSNTVGLAGKVYWRKKDDGANTLSSKSWSSGFEFTGNYRPDTRFAYKLKENLEVGNGLGYLNGLVYTDTLTFVTTPPDYIRNYLSVSSAWTPTARLTGTAEASYDRTKIASRATTDEANLIFNLAYTSDKSLYRANSKYTRVNDSRSRESLRNFLEAQYLPDMFNEATLRFVQQRDQIYGYNASTTYEVLQRYSYKFFTRDGVVRNFATITEEYSFKSAGVAGQDGTAGTDTQYVSLSGRYSPTSRLSLYGSAKYERTDPGITTLFYSGGLNADFRLLTTSIDYIYAKRDSDDRVEKKLAATVRRTF